MSTKNTNV